MNKLRDCAIVLGLAGAILMVTADTKEVEATGSISYKSETVSCGAFTTAGDQWLEESDIELTRIFKEQEIEEQKRLAEEEKQRRERKAELSRRKRLRKRKMERYKAWQRQGKVRRLRRKPPGRCKIFSQRHSP